MDYCRGDPRERDAVGTLLTPEPFRALADRMDFEEGDRVQTVQSKSQGKPWSRKVIRERGAWGTIRPPKTEGGNFQVEWEGPDGAFTNPPKCTKCMVIAYKSKRSKTRRRLSPGETFLHNLRQARPYRDSPVLT